MFKNFWENVLFGIGPTLILLFCIIMRVLVITTLDLQQFLSLIFLLLTFTLISDFIGKYIGMVVDP